jgi:hypothetical protein
VANARVSLNGTESRNVDSDRGIPYRFFVEKSSRDPAGVFMIKFMTPNGFERVPLADLSQAAPPPEWGPEVNGVRCRILAQQDYFRSDETVQFAFAAESTQKSRMLIFFGGDFHTRATLLVDGQPVAIRGTCPQRTSQLHFPVFLFDLTLDQRPQLRPGRHTIKLSVTGDDGTFNIGGQQRRAVSETLVSNELVVEVRE